MKEALKRLDRVKRRMKEGNKIQEETGVSGSETLRGKPRLSARLPKQEELLEKNVLPPVMYPQFASPPPPLDERTAISLETLQYLRQDNRINGVRYAAARESPEAGTFVFSDAAAAHNRFEVDKFYSDVSFRDDVGTGRKSPDPSRRSPAGQGQGHTGDSRIPPKYHQTSPLPSSFQHPSDVDSPAHGLLDRHLFPSAMPSGRAEVVALTNTLELMLKEREEVVGPGDPWHDKDLEKINIPVDLYSDLNIWDTVLSELVRQVHVNCGERGVLLERVRRHFAATYAGVGAHFQQAQQRISTLQGLVDGHLQNTADLRQELAELREYKRLGELRDAEYAAQKKIDDEKLRKAQDWIRELQDLSEMLRTERSGMAHKLHAGLGALQSLQERLELELSLKEELENTIAGIVEQVEKLLAQHTASREAAAGRGRGSKAKPSKEPWVLTLDSVVRDTGVTLSNARSLYKTNLQALALITTEESEDFKNGRHERFGVQQSEKILSQEGINALFDDPNPYTLAMIKEAAAKEKDASVQTDDFHFHPAESSDGENCGVEDPPLSSSASHISSSSDESEHDPASQCFTPLSLERQNSRISMLGDPGTPGRQHSARNLIALKRGGSTLGLLSPKLKRSGSSTKNSPMNSPGPQRISPAPLRRGFSMQGPMSSPKPKGPSPDMSPGRDLLNADLVAGALKAVEASANRPQRRASELAPRTRSDSQTLREKRGIKMLDELTEATSDAGTGSVEVVGRLRAISTSVLPTHTERASQEAATSAEGSRNGTPLSDKPPMTRQNTTLLQPQPTAREKAWNRRLRRLKRELQMPPTLLRFLNLAPHRHQARYKSLNWLQSTIWDLFARKRLADDADDKAGRDRQPLTEFVIDFFLRSYSIARLAAASLLNLVNNNAKYTRRNYLARCFARLLGMTASTSWAGVEYCDFFLLLVGEVESNPACVKPGEYPWIMADRGAWEERMITLRSAAAVNTVVMQAGLINMADSAMDTFKSMAEQGGADSSMEKSRPDSKYIPLARFLYIMMQQRRRQESVVVRALPFPTKSAESKNWSMEDVSHHLLLLDPNLLDRDCARLYREAVIDNYGIMTVSVFKRAAQAYVRQKSMQKFIHDHRRAAYGHLEQQESQQGRPRSAPQKRDAKQLWALVVQTFVPSLSSEEDRPLETFSFKETLWESSKLKRQAFLEDFQSGGFSDKQEVYKSAARVAEKLQNFTREVQDMTVRQCMARLDYFHELMAEMQGVYEKAAALRADHVPIEGKTIVSGLFMETNRP